MLAAPAAVPQKKENMYILLIFATAFHMQIMQLAAAAVAATIITIIVPHLDSAYSKEKKKEKNRNEKKKKI